MTNETVSRRTVGATVVAVILEVLSTVVRCVLWCGVIFFALWCLKYFGILSRILWVR